MLPKTGWRLNSDESSCYAESGEEKSYTDDELTDTLHRWFIATHDGGAEDQDDQHCTPSRQFHRPFLQALP